MLSVALIRPPDLQSVSSRQTFIEISEDHPKLGKLWGGRERGKVQVGKPLCSFSRKDSSAANSPEISSIRN